MLLNLLDVVFDVCVILFALQEGDKLEPAFVTCSMGKWTPGACVKIVVLCIPEVFHGDVAVMLLSLVICYSCLCTWCGLEAVDMVRAGGC